MPQDNAHNPKQNLAPSSVSFNERLLVAAEVGDLAEVKVCLQNNADINTSDNNFRTPLMLAIINCHDAVVDYLMAQDNIQLDEKIAEDEFYYGSPLVLSLNHDSRYKYAKLLLEKDISPYVSHHLASGSMMIYLIAHCFIEPVTLLLDYHFDVNGVYAYDPEFDENGVYIPSEKTSSLLNAVFRKVRGDWKNFRSEDRLIEMLTLLLDRGAEINQPSGPLHETPLMIAAEIGLSDVVRYLLNRGADISLRNKHDQTAEDIAREKKQDEIVYLFECRARLQALLMGEKQDTNNIYQFFYSSPLQDANLITSTMEQFLRSDMVVRR